MSKDHDGQLREWIYVGSVDDEVARQLREKREEAAKAERDTEVARKLAEIDALGADKLPEYAVVAFIKSYDGKPFAYAAIKVVGYWYLTGPVNGKKKMNHDEFCAWLVGGDGFIDYEVLRGMGEGKVK